jgi:hypothetical protein
MAVTKTTREIAELRGGVTFWAQPENPVQHLKLRPGEWVDLKFSVDVVCKSIDEQVCSRYLNGDAVQLTAWWYERDLTHLRVGCKITDSAYTSREFESSPFDFAQPIAEKPKSSIPSETATPKSN